jgi:hypothetical protein
MSNDDEPLPTPSNPTPLVKRVRYFDKQLLHDQDFIDDQMYGIVQRHSHNRLLHAAGIAVGLDVEPVGSLGVATKLKVGAGSGFDVNGRHIMLSAPVEVDVPAATGTAPPAAMSVYIQFSEEATDIQLREPATNPPPSGKATRWKQVPKVFVAGATPAPPADALLLATLTLKADRKITAISKAERLYAGVNLPVPAGKPSLMLRCVGDVLPGTADFNGNLRLASGTLTANALTANALTVRSGAAGSEFGHRLQAQADGLHVKTGDLSQDSYSGLHAGTGTFAALDCNGTLTANALTVDGGLTVAHLALHAPGPPKTLNVIEIFDEKSDVVLFTARDMEQEAAIPAEIERLRDLGFRVDVRVREETLPTSGRLAFGVEEFELTMRRGEDAPYEPANLRVQALTTDRASVRERLEIGHDNWNHATLRLRARGGESASHIDIGCTGDSETLYVASRDGCAWMDPVGAWFRREPLRETSTKSMDGKFILEGIRRLEAREFRTQHTVGGETRHQYYLEATELLETFPGAVSTLGLPQKDEKQPLGVSYESLVVIALAAIKELQAQLDEIQGRNK